VPICDGTRHTFTVRVEASNGVYQAGIAQALTFANIEYAGQNFYGIDDDGALDIVSAGVRRRPKTRCQDDAAAGRNRALPFATGTA
jgi:hypothetical protein